MNQLSLDLELKPVMNEERIFWCCANCLPITGGGYSLTWQPPDQHVGKCEHCGREFAFDSRYGEDELIAAGGKVV